jgi:hypothetical protein
VATIVTEDCFNELSQENYFELSVISWFIVTQNMLLLTGNSLIQRNLQKMPPVTSKPEGKKHCLNIYKKGSNPGFFNFC